MVLLKTAQKAAAKALMSKEAILMGELKDERLVELSEQHNVAQFVSFSPGPTRECRHAGSADRGSRPASTSGLQSKRC